MNELFEPKNVFVAAGPGDPPRKRVRAKAVLVKKKVDDFAAVESYTATITIENADNLEDISGLTSATIGQCTTTGEPITIVKEKPDQFSFEITGDTSKLPAPESETATVTLVFDQSTKVEGGTQENVPYSFSEG